MHDIIIIIIIIIKYSWQIADCCLIHRRWFGGLQRKNVALPVHIFGEE